MIALDTAKFRKVHALMTGGATPGERASAKVQAGKIAARAGLSLDQAVSEMDKPATVFAKPVKGFFDDFEDWMEKEQPGYKAKESAKRSERQDRYAKRRVEILKEFGSARAFLDPTPRELLLLAAGAPFVTKCSSFIDVCGTRRLYASEFAGAHGQFFRLTEVDVKAIDAIKGAYPFPDGVRAAFEELKVWDKLDRDRAHFYDHHEYYFDLPIALRIELLRDVMKTHPAETWDDLEARFKYKAYDWEQQWIDDLKFEDPEWSRLFDDFRIMRATVAHVPQPAPVQSGRRTNADKQADVLSMLDTHPELSDREISRRVDVSPQTVNTWRKRRRSA